MSSDCVFSAGDRHAEKKLANLTEYQKRQIALGALYSNTLIHVDLRHRQWHHAIGNVGVGRKPSQHYNALYGFMTMKEDVLRDYQKPKDSAQKEAANEPSIAVAEENSPLLFPVFGAL